jgi:hypothetical protein
VLPDGDLFGLFSYDNLLEPSNMLELVLSTSIVAMSSKQLRHVGFQASNEVDWCLRITLTSQISMNMSARVPFGVLKKILACSFSMATNSDARLDSAIVLIEPCGLNCSVRSIFLLGSSNSG